MEFWIRIARTNVALVYWRNYVSFDEEYSRCGAMERTLSDVVEERGGDSVRHFSLAWEECQVFIIEVLGPCESNERLTVMK